MSLLPNLIAQAIAFDRGDARRIQHFLKVYAYADTIGRLEGLPDDMQETLAAAAILLCWTKERLEPDELAWFACRREGSKKSKSSERNRKERQS